MRSVRKQARDRRLERRLGRKVSKTGQKCASEVYEAYLAGLQKGMAVHEEQQAALQGMPYQDIFGNEVPSMKMRAEPVDESPCVGAATSPSLSLH